MSLRALSMALVALAVGSACGSGGGGAEVLAAPFQSDPPGNHPSPLAGQAGAPLARPHSGVRRLEFWSPEGEYLAYRERIVTDGQGGYSIAPLEPIAGVHPDWTTFAQRQEQREGFLFRYRDFLIRDKTLFQSNWKQTVLGGNSRVAGQPCAKYRFERLDGTQSSFEASLEEVTGLVLAYEEFDSSGSLRSSMTYESFNPVPNLAAEVMHEPTNEETPTDLATLEAEFDGFVLTPNLVPPGYLLGPITRVREGNGDEWVKLAYSDGIESLFFLHKLPTGGRQEFQIDLTQQGGPSEGVRLFSMGSATVLDAHLAGRDLIVVGKPEEALLLDFLESALP